MFCSRVRAAAAHSWVYSRAMGLCSRQGRSVGVRGCGVGVLARGGGEGAAGRSFCSRTTQTRGRSRAHTLWQYWKEMRQAVGFPSWSRFHVSWSQFRSGAGTKPNSHVLLYGMAAFLWERERVSDQEVLSILQQYKERVMNRLGLPETQDTTPTGTDSHPQLQHAPDSTARPTTSLDSFTTAAPTQRLSDRELRFVQEAKSFYETHSRKHLTELPLVGVRHKTMILYSLTYRVVELASSLVHSRSRRSSDSHLPLVGLTHNPLPYTLTLRFLELLHGAKQFVSIQISQSRLAQQVCDALTPQLSSLHLQQALCDQHSSFIADSTHQDFVLYLESFQVSFDRPNLPLVPNSSKLVAAFLKAAKKFGHVSEENGCHHAFDNVLGIDAIQPQSGFLADKRIQDSDTYERHSHDSHRLTGEDISLHSSSVSLSYPTGREEGWLDLTGTLDSQLNVLTATTTTARSWHFPVVDCQQVIADCRALSLQLPGGLSLCMSAEEGGVTAEEGVLAGSLCSESQSCSSEEVQQPDALLGWELVAEQTTCTVYKKPYEDTGLYQYKVIGTYQDITANDFHEVQVDSEARKLWDSYALKLETIDYDPRTRSEVVHWVMKYPFPMSSREYVFVRRSWISEDEDAIVLVNRSVEHPQAPRGRKYVRVKSYFSEMVIKPHTFIDEVGFDYELTYFDDPQSYLPSSCVNWVTTTAMPDFLGKVHTAALGRSRTTQRHLHGL